MSLLSPTTKERGLVQNDNFWVIWVICQRLSCLLSVAVMRLEENEERNNTMKGMIVQ